MKVKSLRIRSNWELTPATWGVSSLYCLTFAILWKRQIRGSRVCDKGEVLLLMKDGSQVQCNVNDERKECKKIAWIESINSSSRGHDILGATIVWWVLMRGTCVSEVYEQVLRSKLNQTYSRLIVAEQYWYMSREIHASCPGFHRGSCRCCRSNVAHLHVSRRSWKSEVTFEPLVHRGYFSIRLQCCFL